MQQLKKGPKEHLKADDLKLTVVFKDCDEMSTCNGDYSRGDRMFSSMNFPEDRLA